MKEISSALAAHLAAETTTLATLVKITRRDGAVIALTDHDRDLALDGALYKADGFAPSGAMTRHAALKAKDFDVIGFLDSASVDQAEIEAGLYDHARIDVFACNWADLSQGSVHLMRGWLGEVAARGDQYVASLRGLQDLLSRRVGETYTPECRYDCGDARCGVDLAAWTVTGAVTAVQDSRTFADSARSEEDGFFNDASLIWLSGQNAGLSLEVSAWDLASRAFTLWLPCPAQVAVGDAYRVTAGCDKRFATCRARFNNGANYGGFPYLPGIGRVLDYPD